MNERTFIVKIHKLLSQEIYKWKINDPYHGGIPVFVAAGCENRVVLTEDFESVNYYTKQTFSQVSLSVPDFIQKLELHCLGSKRGQNDNS